jgi:glycosyltransferase involved in cell wall biosynthesis
MKTSTTGLLAAASEFKSPQEARNAVRMNVAFCCASISRTGGGVTTAVRELCRSLARETEAAVQVVSLSDRFADRDAELWLPVAPELFEVRGPNVLGYAPAMQRRLAELEPDLIHCHAMWQHPCAAVNGWRAKTGKPYVVSAHGMLHPVALRRARIKKWIASRLYGSRHFQNAAAWHALNVAEYEAIRNYGLKNPVAVIPFGTDLPAEWDHKPATDVTRIVYLGRLHPIKGLDVLLAGWHALPTRVRSECLLTIAGWDDGGHEAKLRRQAEELGLNGSVEFVGPQFAEDKERLFRSARAFVLPSLSEGLPMSVLEAWSYGLPVLMTPQCNLSEGFQRNAAVRAEPTVEGVAAGLSRLLEMSDAERRAMGARGRALVEERFSWPHIARQMAEVYRWLLGGGSPPPCVQVE